jgi:hypothetical protein
MQIIHPDLYGDLGDQILSTDLSFGIRRPVDDRPGHIARNAPATDLPEFEYVSSETDDETTKLYIHS